MSYDARDQSVEDGNPVLLFQFVQGATTYKYALASESVYVVEDSSTWSPVVMVPSEFGHSNDVGKDSLQVAIDEDCALAKTFSGGAPDAITTLTVFRTFTNPATSVMVYWKGRVASVGMEPGRLVLNCEPVFTQLKRPGLRALYTKTCRHVLYGSGCNLSANDFRSTVTIHEAVGNLVTLPEPNVPMYWKGGHLTAPDGTSRMIVGFNGSKLILIRPIQSLNAYVAAHPEGAQVYLYRGCDHSYSTCMVKFNNAGNFGGFPWFAQKNPFTTQVSFA